MIRKLRIQIVLSISLVTTAFVILFLSSTYLSAKNNLESTCYSDMSYILSDITAANQATFPIAVVTVDYSGNCTLLLNHVFMSDKEEILSTASTVLHSSSSSGELDGCIRYMRKSIGYSNIRIALVDASSEKMFLAAQLRNYLYSGIAAIIAFLILGIMISKWISVPVEKAMLAQKQFIANASHELKTPLTVILSNLDMMDSRELSTKNANRMDNIKAESAQMRELIGDMLQLARYDSVLLPVEHSDVDLSYIVQCSVATYEPLAFDKGLLIQADILSGIHILGNEQRLRQLAAIFLDNAMKYSRPSGIISVKLSYSQGKRPLLSVTSQGNAIQKDDLQRIFKSFYRSDNALTSAEGNGLGLSIAAKITEDLDGKIWAESDAALDQNSFYVQFKPHCQKHLPFSSR